MNFANFYRDEKFSDVTTRFSDRTLPCHKLVLCSQSDYFDKLCGKNSHFAESEQSSIELKDDDPDAVEALFRYLYCGRYYDNSHQRCNDWTFHAEVAKSATKYMVGDVVHSATIQSTTLLNRLDKADAIHDALVSIRGQYADDDNFAVQADSMQEKHMNALLQEPRFRASLTPTETDQQLVRLSTLALWVDGIEKKTYWECQGCRKWMVQGGMLCSTSSCIGRFTIPIMIPVIMWAEKSA